MTSVKKKTKKLSPLGPQKYNYDVVKIKLIIVSYF